ncbi:TLD-domain-containing protein [Mycena leptocephala]|nr:TLD-domain-containing protein [Mycena leptocephala]
MSDSLIDSIPVLIPVPASSKPPIPTPPAPKTRAQIDLEAEEAFDKFSTLFSPATPRASPVLDPLFLPEQPRATYEVPEMSPDSEFGSFMSVPAAEDPLSLLTPGLGLASPMQPESTAARPGQPRTPSQTFFDEFSKSAKDRTETKRGLLDELLMHEDDPLYWIKDQSASTSSLQPDEDDLLPSEKPNNDAAPKILVHLLHLRSPTRSPTVTAAPTLAPPLASTSTSADAPGFDFPFNASPSSRGAPPRSNSYASLATLSKTSGAKWVSSFLPSTLSPPSASIPNTSLFPPSPIDSASSSLSNSLTLPHPTPAPARIPEISHFTPFAARADNAYAPPSGAPGFRGTVAYDWDRGFSHALERDLGVAPSGPVVAVPYSDFDEEDELVSGTNANVTRAPSTNGNGNGHGGKREGDGTVGVLTPELVALVSLGIHTLPPSRPAPPSPPVDAFYSLDQHGISLNTLYSRCAPPSSSRPPHPKGALVVIQDAAGVLFGAWIADGLKRSTRGGYYGGGESFLWRYLPSSAKFDVYKWTGKNDYVALCEEGFISFGGGDGRYGLYLDDSLFDGSSARCPTFDNEPLCSGTAGKGGNVNFECVGLEVWGVGS